MKNNDNGSKKHNDHYIPRTYLKYFEDSSTPKHIWVYTKGSENPSGPKRKSTKSVGFEKNGDSLPYFKNRRFLDSYFDSLENQYNKVIHKMENNLETNKSDKLILALNIARMRLWTPKRKALANDGWNLIVEKTLKQLAAHPEALEESVKNCLVDHLADPNVQLKIDQNFSNSHLVKGMVKCGFYYNQMPWSIIKNNTSNPFITSDNPVCTLTMLVDDPDYKHTNIYIPLTPKIAVLIHLVPELIGHESSWGIATENCVQNLNLQIVKFVRKHIISNIKEDWISNLIQQYTHHQEKCHIETIQQGRDNTGDFEILKINFGI